MKKMVKTSTVGPLDVKNLDTKFQKLKEHL